MISTWSDYQDMLEWNRSFDLGSNRDPISLGEDDIHHIFGLMQYGLCDQEIAQMTMVHQHIINKMRIGAIYSEAGSMYDYPMIFTNELMLKRIKQLVVDEGCDAVEASIRTGANYNTIISLYSQFIGTNNHNG